MVIITGLDKTMQAPVDSYLYKSRSNIGKTQKECQKYSKYGDSQKIHNNEDQRHEKERIMKKGPFPRSRKEKNYFNRFFSLCKRSKTQDSEDCKHRDHRDDLEIGQKSYPPKSPRSLANLIKTHKRNDAMHLPQNFVAM